MVPAQGMTGGQQPMVPISMVAANQGQGAGSMNMGAMFNMPGGQQGMMMVPMAGGQFPDRQQGFMPQGLQGMQGMQGMQGQTGQMGQQPMQQPMYHQGPSNGAG